MSACSSCGAPIVWAITAAGKRMPLDPEPVAPEGAILAAHRRADGALEVRHVTSSLEMWPDEHPARTHYATCPNADQHRKA